MKTTKTITPPRHCEAPGPKQSSTIIRKAITWIAAPASRLAMTCALTRHCEAPVPKQSSITLRKAITRIAAAATCLATCLWLTCACTSEPGSDPGPGTLPAIETRASVGDITGGTLEVTTTATDPVQTGRYQYAPATGIWTAIGTDHLSLADGTHPANANARITYNYNSGGGSNNPYAITIPMTWTGNLIVGRPTGSTTPTLTEPIELTPSTAALHVTLMGSYNDQGELTTQSYPGVDYQIIPQIAPIADIWTHAPAELCWYYPAQRVGPPVFQPQTLPVGTHLFTISVSGAPSPYTGQEFTFHLPAALTLEAGAKHIFPIRLDPGSGTATLAQSIQIVPFDDADPADNPNFDSYPGAIYTEAHLRRFAKEWNELPIGDDDARDLLLSRWADANGIIRLKADIHMSDEPLEPIGDPNGGFSRWFDAVFHGENHTITGLKTKGDVNYAGLFGQILGGQVYALHLREAEITGTWNAGGIAGLSDISGLIAGCSFGGEIHATATGNNTDAGGIVGSILNNGTVAGCYADITGITGYRKGGIAGRLAQGGLYGSHWKHQASLNAYGGRSNTGTTVQNCQQITGSPTAAQIAAMNTALDDALQAHAPTLSPQYKWANGGNAGPMLEKK